jgi:hypothetical protein
LIIPLYRQKNVKKEAPEYENRDGMHTTRGRRPALCPERPMTV